MKTLPLIACLFMIAAAGCTTTKKADDTKPFAGGVKPKSFVVIAIPKEGFAYSKFENLLIEQLVHKGYKVAGQSDLEAVLKQQKLQRSIFYSTTASTVGKLLGVDAILFLEATEVSEHVDPNGHKSYRVSSVAARAIDVNSGSVMWIQNDEDASLPFVAELALLPVSMVAGSTKSAETQTVAKLMRTFPSATN